MAVKEVYRQGKTEVDGRAFLDFVVRKEFLFSDPASNVIRIPIEKGRTVLEVRTHTLAAFTGGSPTVSVGDSANATNYLATTDSTITTLNNMSRSSLCAQTNKSGKYYATTDYILLTFSASLTAGKIAISLVMSGYEPSPANMIANM